MPYLIGPFLISALLTGTLPKVWCFSKYAIANSIAMTLDSLGHNMKPAYIELDGRMQEFMLFPATTNSVIAYHSPRKLDLLEYHTFNCNLYRTYTRQYSGRQVRHISLLRQIPGTTSIVQWDRSQIQVYDMVKGIIIYSNVYL